MVAFMRSWHGRPRCTRVARAERRTCNLRVVSCASCRVADLISDAGRLSTKSGALAALTHSQRDSTSTGIVATSRSRQQAEGLQWSASSVGRECMAALSTFVEDGLALVRGTQPVEFEKETRADRQADKEGQTPRHHGNESATGTACKSKDVFRVNISDDDICSICTLTAWCNTGARGANILDTVP